MLIFIVGLALPQAFGREGVLFAVSYALVRFLHLTLYVDASRQGTPPARRSPASPSRSRSGWLLLIIGACSSTAGTGPRCGRPPLAIDYAGPAWLTRERLRGLQQVSVAHFAERYGSFVIICLGESIVAIGVGVGDRRAPSDAALVAAGRWPC